jgi:protein-S-isoprenylcysteine O-methyltransferase Ste14
VKAASSRLATPIHRLFNQETLRAVLVLLRFPLMAAGCVAAAFLLEPGWVLPGIIVSAVGLLGQLWCFASLKKKKVLAEKGLYAIVRNPMYIARYFLIAGVILFTGNLWILLGFTVVYYFYAVNRVGREERKLREVFGEEYERYCARVPRFVPRFRGVDWRAVPFFRWDLFIENHGHWNVAVMAFIYAGALYLALR